MLNAAKSKKKSAKKKSKPKTKALPPLPNLTGEMKIALSSRPSDFLDELKALMFKHKVFRASVTFTEDPFEAAANESTIPGYRY